MASIRLIVFIAVLFILLVFNFTPKFLVARFAATLDVDCEEAEIRIGREKGFNTLDICVISNE